MKTVAKSNVNPIHRGLMISLGVGFTMSLIIVSTLAYLLV